ncbi:DNA-3-methyladenine glycosylase I [Lachnospiraceae bacterium OttesenSCG-928-E19]|nr:DNA-3-methyladenine glycosylase I [Lachnospiraceae bacterium OttesenSCG-928-E19]
MAEIVRCDWAKSDIEKEYHDNIWGRPMHGDKELFKMLILEGQQAGLSWITILKKMDALCEAYDDFDPEIMVNYEEEKIEELMNNAGIIRNRRKIMAAIQNSQAYLTQFKEAGSFDEYLWSYVNGEPIVNNWKEIEEIPAKTEISEMLSKDLKKRGFNFVGPTIVYAFMQAVGMVNDHLVSCGCRTDEIT